jgi:predicted peptidase
VKCLLSTIGCTILGLLAGIGIIEIAANHHVDAEWCYVLGFAGGFMTGITACMD